MTHPNPFPPPQWQPPGYPQHASIPPPKPPFWRSRKGAAVLLGGGLMAAVVIVGNSGSSSSSPPRTPTAPTWSTAAAAPSTQAAAVQSGPLTSFSDGTYEVGSGDGQVAPGKYKSTGPADGPSGICYSSRLKHNDGALGDIIDNDVSKGPAILAVKASDGYVEVSGCTFTKAG